MQSYLCLAFTNTVTWSQEYPAAGEQLNSWNALLGWCEANGLVSEDVVARLRGEAAAEPEVARRGLGRAWSLRQAMHDLFRAAAREERPPAPAVARLNAALRESPPAFAMDPAAEGFALRRVGSRDDDPLGALVLSASMLLASADLVRLRECEAPGCGVLYLDGTRNRSRRWCDMTTCGNRAKAQRYRARRLSRDPRSGA